jgi:hypothetical protein
MQFSLSLAVIHNIRFLLLTAVTMKSSVFWDVTVYSPVKVHRLFGGTCYLHHPGSKNKSNKKPTRNWHQAEEDGLICFPKNDKMPCLRRRNF